VIEAESLREAAHLVETAAPPPLGVAEVGGKTPQTQAPETA
jgi:hypothetical protein